LLQRSEDQLFSVGWKKRYFKLEGDKLYSFRSDVDVEHSGFIDLRLVVSITLRPGVERQILVKQNSKNIYLYCSTDEDLHRWLNGLKAWVDYFHQDWVNAHFMDPSGALAESPFKAKSMKVRKNDENLEKRQMNESTEPDNSIQENKPSQENESGNPGSKEEKDISTTRTTLNPLSETTTPNDPNTLNGKNWDEIEKTLVERLKKQEEEYQIDMQFKEQHYQDLLKQKDIVLQKEKALRIHESTQLKKKISEKDELITQLQSKIKELEKTVSETDSIKRRYFFSLALNIKINAHLVDMNINDLYTEAISNNIPLETWDKWIYMKKS